MAASLWQFRHWAVRRDSLKSVQDTIADFLVDIAANKDADILSTTGFAVVVGDGFQRNRIKVSTFQHFPERNESIIKRMEQQLGDSVVRFFRLILPIL